MKTLALDEGRDSYSVFCQYNLNVGTQDEVMLTKLSLLDEVVLGNIGSLLDDLGLSVQAGPHSMGSVLHAPFETGLVDLAIFQVKIASHVSLDQLGHLFLDRHALEEISDSVIDLGFGILVDRGEFGSLCSGRKRDGESRHANLHDD